MEFVDAGGYRDAALVARRGLGLGRRRERDRAIRRSGSATRRRAGTGAAMFERVPLPPAWPVYVTWAEARAYARWRGRRLPTEAEFHRAAFGTPDGQRARAIPWGDALRRAGRPANFDFARWDPEPVGAHPDGASAFGVHDLVGNGWEWTSTVFAPFDGLRADAVVSGVLGRLLRRRALRDEGRVAGDGARARAPRLPQLVPAALSVRLRDVPLRAVDA